MFNLIKEKRLRKQATRLISFLFFSALVSQVAAQDLRKHRWEDRILLLFAPESSQAFQQFKLESLQERPELADRHLKTYWIIGDQVFFEGAPLPNPRAEAFRQDWKIAEQNTKVLLIGKDGGLKQTQTLPMDWALLYRTIDAMPMRQREMEGAHH